MMDKMLGVYSTDGQGHMTSYWSTSGSISSRSTLSRNVKKMLESGINMSMASRSSSHMSGQSGSTDKSGEYSDDAPLMLDLPPGLQNGHKSYRDRTQAWWSVGEYLENGQGKPLTHQSAKLSLTGNRVFTNQKDDLWDLSDSLMELFEQTQAENMTATLQLARRNKNLVKDVDPIDWLDQDTTNGFVRIYAPNTNYTASQLIPCSLSTSAHKIALMLGISLNALHIQFNGDVIRRLDPYEHPLVLQNEYLAGLGYTDIRRIQEAGMSEDIGFLVRFYAGKPFHDSTFSRNQLEAYIDVRKGKVIQQWVRRLCSISGTRLLIYKDKFKQSKPTVVQLAKGRVEEVKLKGHERCVRLTSTLQGERSIYLSFTNQQEYLKWLRKCKKATDKLPTSADLSNCHLEFLPENLFINDQLAILNLRHNVLKERPIEEDIYTIGWIDDLPRFQNLRSLNLADNQLVQFPLALCYIKSLVELNLASNKLEEVPVEISELTNLQALHLHNNHLTSLPDELCNLRKLFVLVLAFNRFTSIPAVVAYMTDVRISEVENIIMAGNQIEKVAGDVLSRMKYAKKVDLRMNQLTLPPSETVKFASLEHLTHLDIRDNKVVDLDIRGLKTLEYLNCERNAMQSLQINGQALKNIFAANNKIQKLIISPKPEWLLQIDISHNQLTELPEWLSDCFFLQKVQASHNLLKSLPERLFVDAKKLKSLRVHHNQISSLPKEIDNLPLEEIYLQQNQLTSLPEQFLEKANKLRVLNITKNRLTQLPELSDNQDLNKLHEFYAASNALGDNAVSVIAGYPRLKVLNLAHNEIRHIVDEDVRKLDVLTELNLSGNQLKSLPAALGELTKLVTLRAHSNQLQSLPDFKKASSLRVLDVGHNRLMNVSVTSLMASQLNLLDMSLNAQLKVDPAEFKHIKHKKTVCLVDLTGQNRLLPGLSKQHLIEYDDSDGLDPSLPWKAGFSETSGIRNKLCVATLKMLKFRSDDEAVFAMFDGGKNNEVPKVLLESVASLLQSELDNDKTNYNYMKYAMMAAHRQLKNSGQKLGASAVLTHLRRHTNPSTHMNHYVLQLANVGDVEAVLCRRGEALVLTRKFTTMDREECHRIYKSDGIITEDNKVGGTTKNTRLLGCGYLYPHVIPDPHVNTVTLRRDDEFIIVANRGLWRFVSYSEAVEDIYEIGNPVVAAKHLQDLAQGYGSKENIAILVIRLNTDSQPSLWRLRPKAREMSIDDMEAAEEMQKQIQRKVAEVEPMKRDRSHSSLPMIEVTTLENVQEEDPPPPLPSSPPPNVPPPPLTPIDSGSDLSASSTNSADRQRNVDFRNGDKRHSSESSDPITTSSTAFIQDVISIEASPNTRHKSPKRSPVPALKPLPNQKFRKKNAAADWEALLQKRLTEDVKDKEMRLSISQVLSESGSSGSIDSRNKQLDSSTASSKSFTPFSQKFGQENGKGSNWAGRPITMPSWQQRTGPNPAYTSYIEEEPIGNDNDEDILYSEFDEAITNPYKRRSNVKNAIAMFENINQPVKRRAPPTAPAEYRRSISNDDSEVDTLTRGRSRHKQPAPARASFRDSNYSYNNHLGTTSTLHSSTGRVRSASYDIADSRGNDIHRPFARVRYHDAGSHTTIISIPGGTVTSSTTDNFIATTSSEAMDSGDMYATVRRIRHSRPRINSSYNRFSSGSQINDGISEENITVVEIARL